MVEIPGVKIGLTVAGFAGGIVSLSYVRDLTRVQCALAVLSGSLCATYLTPIGVAWFGLSNHAEHAMAFLVGLCAINIVPGFLKLSEMWRDNPLDVLKRKPGSDK